MNNALKFLRIFIRGLDFDHKSYALKLVAKHPDLPEFFCVLERGASKLSYTTQALILEFCVEFINEFGVLPTFEDIEGFLEKEYANNPLELSSAQRFLTKVKHCELDQDDLVVCYKQTLHKHLSNKISLSVVSNLKDDTDPSQLINNLQLDLAQIKSTVTPDTSSPILSTGDFVRIQLKELEEKGLFQEPIAYFGYESMDNAIGGFFPGEIAMVAGPPALGKSFIAQNIFWYNQSKGIPCVYATNEVSAKQYWQRLASFYSGIPIDKLKKSDVTEEEMERFFVEMDKIAQIKNSYFIDPAGCTSTAALRASIESKCAEEPKLIVLDHPQLLNEGRFSNDWENSARAMINLKQLALEWNCAFFCPIHYNRGGNNNADATIGDVKYQTFIEKADTIFTGVMSKDMPYIPPDPGDYLGKPGLIELTTGRSRSSAVGQKFELLVDFSRCKVTDVVSGIVRHDPAEQESDDKEYEALLEGIGD